MKVQIVRDFMGGRWVAKIDDRTTLVPREDDGVESIGDLLRWLGDMDDAIAADSSDHAGIAALVRNEVRA